MPSAVAFPAHCSRRLRRSENLYSLVGDTGRSLADFSYRALACPSCEDWRTPVSSMPGFWNLSFDCSFEQCGEAASLGIRGVIVFGIFPSREAFGDYSKRALIQDAAGAQERGLPGLLGMANTCLMKLAISCLGLARARTSGRAAAVLRPDPMVVKWT